MSALARTYSEEERVRRHAATRETEEARAQHARLEAELAATRRAIELHRHAAGPTAGGAAGFRMPRSDVPRDDSAVRGGSAAARVAAAPRAAAAPRLCWDLRWAELSARERTAAEELGYPGGASWDSAGAIERSWDELNELEQQAAAELGCSEQQWNFMLLQDDEECSSDEVAEEEDPHGLWKLSIRELRARAREVGLGPAALAEAAEEEDQRRYLVPRIVRAESSERGAVDGELPAGWVAVDRGAGAVGPRAEEPAAEEPQDDLAAAGDPFSFVSTAAGMGEHDEDRQQRPAEEEPLDEHELLLPFYKPAHVTALPIPVRFRTDDCEAEYFRVMSTHNLAEVWHQIQGVQQQRKQGNTSDLVEAVFVEQAGGRATVFKVPVRDVYGDAMDNWIHTLLYSERTGTYHLAVKMENFWPKTLRRLVAASGLLGSLGRSSEDSDDFGLDGEYPESARTLIGRCNALELSQDQLARLVRRMHRDGWISDAAATIAWMDHQFFVAGPLFGAAARLLPFREVQGLLCACVDSCRVSIMGPLFRGADGALSPGDRVSLLSCGYVGDAIEIHKCLGSFRRQAALPRSSVDPVLQMVLDPADGVEQPFPTLQPGGVGGGGGGGAKVACNATQLEVERKMSLALEAVQGPPGTGKSTWICHHLVARRQAGRTDLVVAAGNKAVDAVVTKLVGLGLVRELKPVVLGRAHARMGAAAANYTLDALVDRDAKVLGMLGRERVRTVEELRALAAAEDKKDDTERWSDGPIGRVFAAVEAATIEAAALLVGTVSATKFLCADSHRGKEKALWLPKLERAPLATILVDEASSLPEHAIPLLLRLSPEHLVLVGDHKQLEPFSAAPPGTRPPGSLLQRYAAARRGCHMLTVQYRMPPLVAELVSQLFYDGLLVTAPSRRAAAVAQQPAHPPITWHHPQDVSTFGRARGSGGSGGSAMAQHLLEKHPPGERREGTSYSNPQEAAQIRHRYKQIRRRVGGADSGVEVLVIVFYKSQLHWLQRELKLFLDPTSRLFDGRLYVRTVDEAQGSEADVVLLSCVRSNLDCKIGFLAKSNRLCVALSRAKRELHVFGDAETCRHGSPLWRKAVRLIEAPVPAGFDGGGTAFDAGGGAAAAGSGIDDALDELFGGGGGGEAVAGKGEYVSKKRGKKSKKKR